MTLTSFIDSCWYVFEAQAIANVYLSRTQNAGSESTNYFEARTSRPTHIDPSRVYGDPSTDPVLINIHYPPSQDQPSRYWQHRWFVQDGKERISKDLYVWRQYWFYYFLIPHNSIVISEYGIIIRFYVTIYEATVIYYYVYLCYLTFKLNRKRFLVWLCFIQHEYIHEYMQNKTFQLKYK